MNEHLVAGVHNPQLLNFQNSLDLSDFAFVVQCSNIAAEKLLSRNPLSVHPDHTVLGSFSEIESDRETPCIGAGPTAWLFPRWKPDKGHYTFGVASQSDIVIPHRYNASRKAFALYLSHSGSWMLMNMSRQGTLVDGVKQTQISLHPDSPNNIRVGNFECSIHPIPHTPSTADNSGMGSLLFELDLQVEGTSTTTLTQNSEIDRRSCNSSEAYYYLPKRKIPVQGDSEVLMAVRKTSGQYCVAKLYKSEDEHAVYQQYEKVFNLRVCILYLMPCVY